MTMAQRTRVLFGERIARGGLTRLVGAMYVAADARGRPERKAESEEHEGRDQDHGRFPSPGSMREA